MNQKIILIMGLPGAGKTTLADALAKKLKQRDLMLTKLEKKLMIGIFLRKGERGKQKECQILLSS